MHSAGHVSAQHSAVHSSSAHFEHPAAAVVRTNLSFEPAKHKARRRSSSCCSDAVVTNDDDDDDNNNNKNNNSSSDNNDNDKNRMPQPQLHLRRSYYRDVPIKMLEEHHGFSSDTWMSLLGLLNPIEFFVTVDSFPIWRSHVAWAKPDGNDLRNYTIQRFSSNMVLLSLLLGTEMTFLLDSETRQALKQASYTSFVFWLGITIMISACITVIGLVATFTAWGMVSAISDANTHCLLRSSIGQYVTSLPAHFVVASLYIFFLWLIMWIVNLLEGGFICLALIGWVCVIFFRVVISLSAFGRLIIHTGAMGDANVLDPAIEKRLIPSGLHASLLIKAMHRKRQCANAVSQYQAPRADMEELKKGDVNMPPINSSNYGSVTSTSTAQQFLQRQNSSLNSLVDSPSSMTSELNHDEDLTTSKRLSVQDSFPRPSILNNTDSKDLFAMVETVLSQCALSDIEADQFMANLVVSPAAGAGHRRTRSALDAIEEQREEKERDEASSEFARVAISAAPATNSDGNSPFDIERCERPISADDNVPSTTSATLPFRAYEYHSRSLDDVHTVGSARPHRRPSPRRSMVDFFRVQMRRASWLDIKQEWIDENDARDLYNAPPPDDGGFCRYAVDDDDNNHNDDREEAVPSHSARIRKRSPGHSSLPPALNGRKFASSTSFNGRVRGEAHNTSPIRDGRRTLIGESDYLLPKE